MSRIAALAIAVLVLGLLAGGAAFWSLRSSQTTVAVVPPPPQAPTQPTAEGRSETNALFVAPNLLEDGGLGVALSFTRPVRDSSSLGDLASAIQGRGELGLEVLNAELQSIPQDERASVADLSKASILMRQIALLQMYEGRFALANASLGKCLELGVRAGMPERARAEITAVRGIVSLRLGEISNCIACMGPTSCIFPIAPEAVHQQEAGSRQAIAYFLEYLKQVPGDLRVRWLLNLAYMTLGEYPAKVPQEFLIPMDTFESKLDPGRFSNVAPKSGLTSRGTLAGGSIFDDFTGDGLPDLFVTSLDADRGASFFVNRGDGTFEDRSSQAGLDDQIYALNVVRGDMDNDGDLDLALLRGGWEAPMRLSLLRNNGDATFADVTLEAGLGEPITTEAAAWGDFDNDGLVDLFVCGEYLSPFGGGADSSPNPSNRSRLYRNKGDGTFEDVAAKAGVANEGCAKGCAWSDYDGDGHLDLFVSNMTTPCRLYHNNGDGTFEDRAASLGVTGAERSFACWFWDFDNDGRQDLFVNDYTISLAETAAQALKFPYAPVTRPRLYRNLGSEGFRDVTSDVGLDRASSPMGCNFGDIDNDGYLDMYLGTGGMSYEYLVPNLMFKNVLGAKFEDVTMSSGTGHLQKGHGISFADYDNDGHLDLFCEAGGAVPGDDAYNFLFRNPGHDAGWLRVKLVGQQTNRAALGAQIRAVVKGQDGVARTIYRTVGNNSSFGGNSLAEQIGLGDAREVAELEISWPRSKIVQRFEHVSSGQTIVITESVDGFLVQGHARDVGATPADSSL